MESKIIKCLLLFDDDEDNNGNDDDNCNSDDNNDCLTLVCPSQVASVDPFPS